MHSNDQGPYPVRRPVPPLPAPTEDRAVVPAVIEAFFGLVLMILMVVGTVLELAGQAVAGGTVQALRSLRLVRHRIDVMGLEGDELRSLSVVLVRGSRQEADAVAERMAARLAGWDTPDLGVPVHSHESFWP
jgi:hypothetical protein